MSTLQTLNLTINGAAINVTVEPDTPLLWVLRDELKLNGTKFGCGLAQCGACTVVIDGQATRSCIMPVQFLQDKNILTIEGLAPEHPIKQAWIDLQVPQCGYCQSGQMMSAYSLLSNNPEADDAAIKDYMSGNICRCGTYPKIMKAISQAQDNMQKDQTGVGYFEPSESSASAENKS